MAVDPAPRDEARMRTKMTARSGPVEPAESATKLTDHIDALAPGNSAGTRRANGSILSW